MISVLISVAILQKTVVYDPKPLPPWVFTVDLSSELGLVDSKYDQPYFVSDITNLLPDELDFRFGQVLPAPPKGSRRGNDSTGKYSIFNRDVGSLSRVLAIGPKNELGAYGLAAFERPGKIFLAWAKNLRSKFGPPGIAQKLDGKKRSSPTFSNVTLVWVFADLSDSDPDAKLILALTYTPGYTSRHRNQSKRVPEQTQILVCDGDCPRTIFEDLEKI